MIHESAIGGAEWYKNLLKQLDDNVHELEVLKTKKWYERYGSLQLASP